MGSNNSGYLLVPTIALTILAILFAALRFWARRLRRIAPGADDYLALAALVLQCGITLIAICAVVYGGVGQDVDIVLENNATGLQTMLKVGTATSESRSRTPRLMKNDQPVYICFLHAVRNRIATRQAYRTGVILAHFPNNSDAEGDLCPWQHDGRLVGCHTGGDYIPMRTDFQGVGYRFGRPLHQPTALLCLELGPELSARFPYSNTTNARHTAPPDFSRPESWACWHILTRRVGRCRERYADVDRMGPDHRGCHQSNK